MIDSDTGLLQGTGRRNAFSTVGACCDEAAAQGIRIVRGALFDWTGPDPLKPIACDGLGAVMWCMGHVDVSKSWPDRAPRPFSTVGQILRVDSFWLYRFCIGWDNWHRLIVYTEGKDGTLIPHDDDVSFMAIKLSKEKTRRS